MSEHKMVYGLCPMLFYSLGGRGNDWRRNMPTVLQSFDNPVLISIVDMPQIMAKEIYDIVGQDRLYLDSGGFQLYKKETKLEPTLFAKECEKMRRKFMKMASLIKCNTIFELDNEYFRVDPDPASPKNYCREDIKKITGKYPVPVFKLHQGFQYWKDLCDGNDYPMLEYRDWETDRKSTRLNSSHSGESRMPSSA